MGQQVMNGDFVSLSGIIRDKLCNVVIQAQLSLLHQHQHGNGCELFGDGPDFKDHFGLHGHIEFKAGHAESFAVNHLTVFCHQNGCARLARFINTFNDLIHDRFCILSHHVAAE
ncbi:hypothetical protein DSECCO2_298100 [anaerobic digester metagenome]